MDKVRHIHEMYIESPDEYFINKGVWTNFNDFLCIDTTKYIKTIEEWRKYCKNLKINSLVEYDEKYEIYMNAYQWNLYIIIYNLVIYQKN